MPLTCRAIRLCCGAFWAGAGASAVGWLDEPGLVSLLGPGAVGDGRLERLLRGLETAKAEDLSALLFHYRLERYGLKALPYLLGWR